MTTTTTESVVDEESRRMWRDMPVIQHTGFFEHDTGDTYEGFFEARRKDRSVKMHGPGMYKTAEGDIYTGVWDLDRLGVVGDATIVFSDQSSYQGPLRDWTYFGGGKYTYADGSVIQGNFADNCPVGQLTLTDPNGHIWLGNAEKGFAWFEPVNHYYAMLGKRSDSHLKHRKRTLSASPADVKDSK